jgi:hypothetical protein
MVVRRAPDLGNGGGGVGARMLGFRGREAAAAWGKTPRVRAALIRGPRRALACGPEAETAEVARGRREPDSGSSPGPV